MRGGITAEVKQPVYLLTTVAPCLKHAGTTALAGPGPEAGSPVRRDDAGTV